MLFQKWIPICATANQTLLFAAKNALDAKNIPYRVETTDSSLRVSMNNLGGGAGAGMSRDGYLKSLSTLSVREQDEEAARLLLRSCKA